MSQEFILAIDKDTRNNPQKIADMILTLADDIESCKNDLSEIRNRGMFKRLFSNNTRDLAESMIKQNDTISLFLQIVQALIVFNMHNVTVLGEIQREIKMQEEARGVFQNKYVDMAKEYIAESYQVAVAFKEKLDQQEAEISILKNKVDAMESSLSPKMTKIAHSQLPTSGSEINKSLRWQIVNSLWILLTLTIGFLNGAAFLYIGRRAKQKQWIIWGIIYQLPGMFMLVLPKTPDILLSALVIVTPVSFIHALKVRKKYLSILSAQAFNSYSPQVNGTSVGTN